MSGVDQLSYANLTSNIALKGALVVEIGPKRKKFSIHKALLAEHSAFFRGAMRGPWKEAQEGVVTLDDIEPDTCKCQYSATDSLPEAVS